MDALIHVGGQDGDSMFVEHPPDVCDGLLNVPDMFECRNRQHGSDRRCSYGQLGRVHDAIHAGTVLEVRSYVLCVWE